MPDRDKRPAPGQPGPDKIAVYLSDARQTMDEKRRVAGVRTLHGLLRLWQAEARAAEAAAIAAHAAVFESLPPGTPPEVVERRAQAETAAIADAIKRRRKHWETPCDKGGLGAPPGFEPMLRIFFEHAGRAIFATPDPLAAMRVFWKRKPRRGRKAEANAERDLAFAVAVQERVDAGAGATSQDAAIAAVAAEARGGRERVFPSDENVHKIYYRLKDRACLTLAQRALQESWRSGQEWDWSAFVRDEGAVIGRQDIWRASAAALRREAEWRNILEGGTVALDVLRRG
jgi:hypothetical protein